jgi:hypothetical protein
MADEEAVEAVEPEETEEDETPEVVAHSAVDEEGLDWTCYGFSQD